MKIALAGNPNSGKTTLFNAITGKIEHVGNWPGVTVAKKEGGVKKALHPAGNSLRVVDLPGTYSLSPFTGEESITSSFILRENPDVIINIVEAASLRRSLLLTLQLLELGIPLVVALNKNDILRKKGIEIDIVFLAEKLGCPVVETSSIRGEGLALLLEKAAAAGTGQAGRRSITTKQTVDHDTFEAANRKRFELIDQWVSRAEIRPAVDRRQRRFDAIDRIAAHRIWGLPVFAAVIFLVFSLSQSTLGPFLANILVGWIDRFYAYAQTLLGDGVSPFLRMLLLDGIIGGVGAVVGFLPLIMVLFFLLALLEDCGYMARVAIVMDRYLKKVGLSGRSVIPMVIGTGCSVPGIMATRTIRDTRQRRTTALLTPMMPCGAKLPVIALFSGIFFRDAAWVGTAMYFLAIGVIILGALVIRKITRPGPLEAYFIMELPEYRLPSLKRAFLSMLTRGKAFVVKAGTVILVCNAAIQIMQSFTWRMQLVEPGREDTSILAGIAAPLALLLLPLGFGVWQLAAASLTGFIAKESIVGTLAVVYGINNFIDTEQLAFVSGAGDAASVMGLTSAAALAFLVFNLFVPPCFAAIGAMHAEMESRKWFWAGIGFQFGLGYTLSYFVYQIGTLLTIGRFGSGALPGLAAVAVIAVVPVLLARRRDIKQTALRKRAL